MKKNILITAALCGATFLSGCIVEGGPYVRRVSVTAGAPYYYGPYDAYTPYYSYGGRRYYRTGNRYVYYTNQQPRYVSSLPGRSIYVTPPRHVSGRYGRVTRHYHY